MKCERKVSHLALEAEATRSTDENAEGGGGTLSLPSHMLLKALVQLIMDVLRLALMRWVEAKLVWL